MSGPPGEQPDGPAAAHRSGFACIVGRPNAGKSTLLNALVGEKIAIVSDKPQTTRRAIRGIVTRPDAQLVVVDTPGLHRPRTLLGERLDDLVRSVFADVDVIGFCVPADERIGPGDRRIAGELADQAPGTPVIGILTKIDTVRRDRLPERLQALGDLADFAHVVPVSAVRGEQVGLLADLLVQALPPGPRLYPDGEVTDEPVEATIAELVREAALDGVRDELPHSIAVVVTEMAQRSADDGGPASRPLTDIYATLYVERPSQKGIIIGHKGSRLSTVGSRARAEIERLLGTRVYLDLHVAVAKDWQRDPKQLRKLGFDD